MAKTRQISERMKIVMLIAFLAILGAVIAINATIENTAGVEAVGSPSPTLARDVSADPAESDASVPESSGNGASEVLTSENNPEFAAVLEASNDDTALFQEFASKYAGREIAFDGVIAYMQPHADYKTRFDFLIYPGDSPEHASGPSFKIEDKNVVSDMKFAGPNIPEYISAGQTFRFTARIIGFSSSDSTLFMLEPIQTEWR